MLNSRNLVLILFLAGCSTDQTPERIPASQLAAGTYEVIVTRPRFLRSAQQVLQGVLVMSDSGLSTRAFYLALRPMNNGCIQLRGDLDAIAVPTFRLRRPVPDSMTGFTSWRPVSPRELRLTVFQGIDFSYMVRLVAEQHGFEGKGRYFGVGSGQDSFPTQWKGRRIGQPDLRHCNVAFRRDSVLAFRQDSMAAMERAARRKP